LSRADLHVHTTYSPDTSTPPETHRGSALCTPKHQAVAITDHNTIEGYNEVKKLAAEHSDIAIIAVAEINTTEGEIIVLFIKEVLSLP